MPRANATEYYRLGQSTCGKQGAIRTLHVWLTKRKRCKAWRPLQYRCRLRMRGESQVRWRICAECATRPWSREHPCLTACFRTCTNDDTFLFNDTARDQHGYTLRRCSRLWAQVTPRYRPTDRPTDRPELLPIRAAKLRVASRRRFHIQCLGRGWNHQLYASTVNVYGL